MKIAIIGSLSAQPSHETITAIIETSGLEITHIVETGLKGVGRSVRAWARRNGIPCTTIRADWQRHGRRAAQRRDAKIVCAVSGLIAINAPGSRDTAATVERARAAKIPVRVHVLE